MACRFSRKVFKFLTERTREGGKGKGRGKDGMCFEGARLCLIDTIRY